MNKIKKIAPTPFILAEEFAIDLVEKIRESSEEKRLFTLVLSGGSTPYYLYSILTDQYSNSIDWEFVHLFWGDERCVHPTHPESNYGMALHNLIDKIEIPEANIHRIKGEQNPRVEALRYSEEIVRFTRTKNGLPQFDLIILGLGEDGHVASIFPDNLTLFNSDKICETATHPVTLQKRVTITGPVINNAESVVILVAGKNKAGVVSDVFNKTEKAKGYPVSMLGAGSGSTDWYLDKDAAIYLK